MSKDARYIVKDVMYLWCRYCNSQVRGWHFDDCPKGGLAKRAKPPKGAGGAIIISHRQISGGF